MTTKPRDALIIGAGPVGLLLAQRLHQLGLHSTVLEAQPEPRPHSRAIGIHPPSLELLDALNLAQPFLDTARRIRRGLALADNHRLLGQLHFAHVHPRFPFILSLDQTHTETFLARNLPDLRYGAKVTACTTTHERATVELHTGETLHAPWLIGCDGKHSHVRTKLDPAARLRTFPDTYTMGDFAEHLPDETDTARIYLLRSGLVESFPLDHHRRRWILHGTPTNLAHEIQHRTGLTPDPTTNSMLATFQPEIQHATCLAHQRILLAGDAAHLMPPFGGQGMNVGWQDAWDAAEVLRGHLTPDAYQHRVQRRARRFMRRALWNLRQGHPHNNPLRPLLLRTLLRSPLRHRLARQFAMTT